MFLALKEGEGAHDLRNRGDLYKQKKARKHFPLEASERNSPVDTVSVAHRD